MSPRAILYARVSTADKGQDYRAQLEELQAVATSRGWVVVGTYYDETSGTKALRPGLWSATQRARAGGVDILAAVATDRIARSVRNLLDLVEELQACGVKLACTREGALDATTPQGRAFLQVRAVFAELERNLTSERVREGLAVRRARGVKLGRPRTLSYDSLPLAQRLRGSGHSWGRIAEICGGSAGAWSMAVTRAGLSKPSADLAPKPRD